MKSALLAICMFFASAANADCGANEPFERLLKSKQHTVTGPFTVEELERNNQIEIRKTGETLPFGYANEGWKNLKQAKRPGDEIFYVVFRDGRFGMAQHILVQEGCVTFWLLDWIT